MKRFVVKFSLFCGLPFALVLPEMLELWDAKTRASLWILSVCAAFTVLCKLFINQSSKNFFIVSTVFFYTVIFPILVLFLICIPATKSFTECSSMFVSHLYAPLTIELIQGLFWLISPTLFAVVFCLVHDKVGKLS